MIKKVIPLFLIVFSLFSNQTFAHTGLKDSTPKDKEVVTESLDQMTMNFNTNVEQTSTIEVLDSNGESVDLGNLVIEGSKIGVPFLEPLGDGSYRVLWKIVGVDGHPIKGEFSFVVELPNETPVQEDQTAEPPKQEKNIQQEKSENELEKENERSQKKQELPAYLFPSIVALLTVVGIASLWWLARRK